MQLHEQLQDGGYLLFYGGHFTACKLNDRDLCRIS